MNEERRVEAIFCSSSPYLIIMIHSSDQKVRRPPLRKDGEKYDATFPVSIQDLPETLAAINLKFALKNSSTGRMQLLNMGKYS